MDFGQDLVCQKCALHYPRHPEYLAHIQLVHKHEKYTYPCPYTHCKARHPSYNALRLHLTRYHTKLLDISKIPTHNLHNNTAFICTRTMCAQEFETQKELEEHIRDHLRKGDTITCPFSPCTAEYKVLKTFNVHKCRVHRKVILQPQIVTHDNNSAQFSDSEYQQNDENMEIDDEVYFNLNTEDLSKQFTLHLAKFFLKLEAEKLVPLNTIQIVSEELSILVEYYHNILIKMVRAEIKKINFSEMENLEIINQIVSILDENNILYNALCRQNNNLDNFNTIHSRNKIIDKYFPILYPNKCVLNNNASSGKIAMYHYVPMEESLKILLKNKLFKQFVDGGMHHQDSVNGVLQDYRDGQVYKRHVPNKSDAKVIDIFLYQDDAEVANPIGSARSVHKITGTYFTVGNIPPESRSKLESIFLVSLCKSKYIKTFGEEICHANLINDLMRLEQKGLDFEGEKYVPKLVFVLGDNLGSNALGGFTTNFSGANSHFCRFCHVSLSEFRRHPLELKSFRTSEDYDNHLRKIARINKILAARERAKIRREKKRLMKKGLNVNYTMQKKKERKTPVKPTIVKGVKKNSLLNNLANFNVCSPGLPPCIAHDLLEGVVSYDLCLILKDLICKKKWFSLEKLNNLLIQFKFASSKNICRPVPLKPNFKSLGGSASQNWSLLRYLSIIISCNIKDPQDETWTLYLILKEITEYCFAPKITFNQLEYLKGLISEYIDMRITCFPKVKLRPKHHYLTHYPDLFVQYGPLIKLWTMRFESKHSYFKNIARMCKNFRNITKTLSVKHQKLFSYTMEGDFLESRVFWSECRPVKICDYKDDFIRNILSSSEFSSANETMKINMYGTEYNANDWLIIQNSVGDEGKREVAKIKVILIDKRNNIHFIVARFKCQRDLNLGTLKIDTNYFGEIFDCFSANTIADYYPLDAFEISGKLHITQKHSVI